MTLHIANYVIVMAPAGMAVLAILFAIAIVGFVLLVQAIRRRP